ncbi:MAG: hypothetical protein AABY22_05675, partial [Nanoarchaeota archaeon]
MTLRNFIFNFLGERTINWLRYMKFRYKFNRLLENEDRDVFIKKFSKSYESEMKVIPRVVKNPKVIIDLGANYGTYTLFLSTIYPRSYILSFEPVSKSYKILE